MTQNPDLILERFIPYLLSVLSNEISQNIANQYETGFGIDMPQWRAMAILGEYSALSAMEIAEKTAMDKVAVSRAIKKLLTKNLVVRKFSTQDKRRSIIDLSDEGRNMYSQIVPIAKQYESLLLAGFNQTELDQLITLLTKLRDANKILNNQE